MTPSKSQITKAGRTLRKWRQGTGSYSAEQISSALHTINQFRASHSTPLTTANNGLRSMMATEGIQGRPTQRLKRVTTIVDKLIRFPGMALPNMQDIAGCRVVCSNMDELRRLEARVRSNRPPSKAYDYISQPKASGYRAVHLVVVYGERQIEIQIRTELMHAWAVLQESVGALLNVDLKSGFGPCEVLDHMMLLSQSVALTENSEPVPTDLSEQVRVSSQSFISYLRSQFETGRLPGV